MEKKKTEFRHDILSNDWVVVAPKRRLRIKDKEDCPFCDIKDRKPVIVFNKGKKVKDLEEWTTAVIPNKYPVLSSKEKIKEEKKDELHIKMTSGGFHEIVVTREHNKPMAKLSIERIKEVIQCYKERHLELKKHDFVKYILVFHNHGKDAGASQKHPHSQILTAPVIDKEFRIILSNAKKYFKENKSCLQCKINELEIKDKKRIVFENKDFIAFCPFAPKFLFQVMISPKKHSAFFDEITDDEMTSLAEVFKEVLLMYNAVLTDPPYNFYLHTVPCKKNISHSYFHWYFNFFPRLSKLAGFEMGANMEILVRTPEEQARLLRNKKHV